MAFFSNRASNRTTNRMPPVRNKWRPSRIPGSAAYAAFFLSQNPVTTTPMAAVNQKKIKIPGTFFLK